MTATDFTLLEELDAAATLQSLMDQVAEVGPAPSVSGKARAAQIAAAISDKDLDELSALQTRMVGIIDQIVANSFDPDHPVSCSESELESLMTELLDQKDVKRLVEVRYQMIRAQIFAHITEANRLKDLPDPARAPGEAVVPALKKKFSREGGRLKASLDQDALRAALGPKRWKKICTERTVPATAEHIELVLDEDKILELVRKDPKVLEVFRDCVRANGYTPQSLQIRNL